MITKLHKGRVENGRFIADNPGDYALRYCAHEGKRIEETVTRERKRKSKQQRGYYFGCIVYLLADELNGDVTPAGIKEMHLSLRAEFLTNYMESGLPKVRSTEDLSTVECEEYHEKIRRWALTKHNIRIPEPGEVDY